jgi:hypothetical protein
MKQTRRARHNRRHGGVKNATLKAEKAALRSQKRAEAQILKDVRAFKKEEKARIKEEKARHKALKKTKKAKPKAETSADVAKLEKLALELYKKSSAMKAKAKADLIQMARNTDKESIDIMLENNFYELNNKQLEAWIAKARIQANKK